MTSTPAAFGSWSSARAALINAGARRSASRSLHAGAHINEDLVDRVEADPPQARVLDVENNVDGERNDAGEPDLVKPIVALLSRRLIPREQRGGERERDQHHVNDQGRMDLRGDY